MKQLIRSIFSPRRPRLKIDLYDRHAEHIDPNVPLCNHRTYVLRLGDFFHGIAEMDISASLHSSGIIDGKAEFSIEFVDPDRIRVVIDMPDYIAARRIAKGA